MRKIFLAAIFFIVLSLGFLFLPKTADARCPTGSTTVSQNTFDPEFRGEITISNNQACFKDIEYTILAYPNHEEGNPNTNSNFFIGRQESNNNSITLTLNLLDSGRGRTNPGPWTLKICLASSPSDCDEEEKILDIIPITVSGASASVPTDVPKVSMNGNQCVYQAGDEVNLNFDNLQPGQRYRWWWSGEKKPKKDVITSLDENDPNNHTGKYTIPPEETQKIGIRTFCLDVHESIAGIDRVGRCDLGYPNSITLKFEATLPVGDKSCSSEGGYQNPKLIDGPPLPCEEGLDKDGGEIETLKTPQLAGEIVTCTRVKTAVGSIGTDPAEFIKSIFSLLLGVAGGIAVILIIISGYRLMASQGNPEKVQGAREMLTSAIVGLLFIIFSFVILQVIGVDILKIPGFSK